MSLTSLYVHIPFCQHKCFYCSFVVTVGQEHRIDEYLLSLAQEAKQYQGARLKTLYFGGGTPSLLSEKQLQELFGIIHQYFNLDSVEELTLEANPEGLSVEKAAFLRELGVRRVSLGVQTFHDPYLKYLGRNHSAAKARGAFLNLREAGFDNINVDLMYGFPKESLKEIEEDLQELIQLDSEHVSLYTLTIEANTRFATRGVQLEGDDEQAAQYRYVQGFLEDHGWRQYEISNFAKKGKESRHNINYWSGGDYIGLGVGAHSHLQGKRFWNTDKLMDYLKRNKEGATTIEGKEVLNQEERFLEYLLFGLRMNQGIDLEKLQNRLNVRLDSSRLEKIEHYIEEGFLCKEKNSLKTTAKGQLVLDELCARLI